MNGLGYLDPITSLTRGTRASFPNSGNATLAMVGKKKAI